MSIRAFTLLSIALVHLSGFAIPMLSKPGCNETSYQRGLREMVHKIGVIGEDNRMLAETLTQQNLITPAEEAYLRKVNGSIHCPVMVRDSSGKEVKKWATGSASVVNNGRTLVSAAHVFFNPQTRTPVPRLSECYFMNREANPRVIALDLKDSYWTENSRNRFVLGTRDPWNDKRNDRAVVRLKEDAGDFIPVDQTSDLSQNPKVFNFSRPHFDMVAKGVSRNALIGQICNVRGVDAGPTDSASISTDCDSAQGGSGSILMTVDRSNRAHPFRAIGVVNEAIEPGDQVSNQPFDFQNNNTVALAIDRLFADEIKLVSSGPSDVASLGN